MYDISPQKFIIYKEAVCCLQGPINMEKRDI